MSESSFFSSTGETLLAYYATFASANLSTGGSSTEDISSSKAAAFTTASPSSSFDTCYSVEGWGPYSAIRNTDLTPCFETGILLSIPAFLFVLGALLSLFVWRKNTALERGVESLRVMRVKLIVTVLQCVSSIVHLVFAIKISPAPLKDQLVHFSILLLVASLISLPLIYQAHLKTRRSSDALLIWWFVNAIVSVARVRTMVLAHESTALFVSYICFLSFGLPSFILECLGPEYQYKDRSKAGKIKLTEEEDGSAIDEEKENPALVANFFSRMSFSWLTPLMQLGANRFIQETDIFSLDPTDESHKLGGTLAKHWSESVASASKKSTVTKHVKPSLWVALAKSYGGTYAISSFLKLCNDILSFSQPQLLRLLLKFVATYSTDNPEPPIRGIIIAVIMFLFALIQTVILHQYFDGVFKTTMRVKSGLIVLIYGKSLRLGNGARTGRATGDIVNLMSVDAVRLSDLCQYGQMVWSGPVQITLSFVSLYNLLGWPAFCGVAVMILSLPANTAIARYQKKLSVQQMKIKDKRTRLMNEVLSNIKSIKLYAWEKAFSKKVLDVRNAEELAMIRKIGIVNACSNFFWASTPFLVAFATFGSYAFSSKEALTSDVIFPAISLFGLLQFPLAVFSNVISSIIEALVSESRLVDFLDAEELQTDARTVTSPSTGLRKGEVVASITDGEFSWNPTSLEPTLKDINLTAKKGELIAVLGRVGSGKTSLLAGILGEMTRRAGSVELAGNVAYFAQSTFVLSATVRENIVFGHRFEPEFYQKVLEACALLPDLKILPQGDSTEIGEKGVSLSGGQKARIALARAVYARADLYLLDDPLSAVDNHVAAHLFEQVLGPHGLLKGKARILCTNSIAFLGDADKLVMMKDGLIDETTTYTDVMAARSGALFTLINGIGKQAESPDEVDDGATAVADSPPVSIAEAVEDEVEKTKRRLSISSLHRADLLSDADAKRLAVHELRESAKPKEVMQRGEVKTHVYSAYISAASRIGVICFLLATFAGQGTSIAGNMVLRSWGETNLSAGRTAKIGLFLTWYGLFGLSSSALNFASSLLLWVFCAVRCSQKLHDGAFSAMLRSPLSFFEITPQGRVLNIFSRDVYVVDEVLIRTFSGFFRTLASVGGVLFIIGLGAPWVLLGVIPIGFIYRRIMKYYLATSRELKRLDAVSRAPIFSWFGETLSGLTTIRAYGHLDRFITVNEARIDRNQSCYLPSVSVNRWLAVRLELLGSLIMLAAASFSVFALATSRNVDAGLVGLMMSYAVSVTGSLNWVVRSASEVETNIVSVERIMQYMALPSEAPADIEETKPVPSWPQTGRVEFKNYSTRYRPELPDVIHGIDLNIAPGEKVGVCGRTGAGKSSLTLALFRIIEATSGRIEIDGVDISTIGLHDLRSALSIIPQDPQLFEGTLRENVDPINQFEDVEIWDALDKAHLKTHVELNGGLDGAVAEGGQNLSSGQRQLICFARALLRKSRIIVLDEATSALDRTTDTLLQEILKSDAFDGCTIITIAHRLDTILHSDKILVMEQGEVAEFDAPQNLLKKKESLFYSLALKGGLVGALEE